MTPIFMRRNRTLDYAFATVVRVPNVSRCFMLGPGILPVEPSHIDQKSLLFVTLRIVNECRSAGRSLYLDGTDLID